MVSPPNFKTRGEGGSGAHAGGRAGGHPPVAAGTQTCHTHRRDELKSLVPMRAMAIGNVKCRAPGARGRGGLAVRNFIRGNAGVKPMTRSV